MLAFVWGETVGSDGTGTDDVVGVTPAVKSPATGETVQTSNRLATDTASASPL